MARKIVITSGKGGVGKTTFCANLAISLANLGVRVCVIDLDIGLNNLDVALNVENKIIYDIVDVAENKCRVTQALVTHDSYSNLFILPTNQSFARHTVTSEKLNRIVSVLNESFEFVLIDCPAGIDDGFYKAISVASEAIIITTPHIFAIRDASKVMRILVSMSLSCTNLVVNRVRPDLVIDGEMLTPDSASKLISCPLIGVICESDKIATLSKLNGVEIDAKLKKNFEIIAKNLINGTRDISDFTKEYRGIFGAIKRKLKKV